MYIGIMSEYTEVVAALYDDATAVNKKASNPKQDTSPVDMCL